MQSRVNIFLKNMCANVDVASVVMLRIVFGVLMFWEMARYYYNGWIRELYVKSQLFFQYEWFQWLCPLPEIAMYTLFASLAILSKHPKPLKPPFRAINGSYSFTSFSKFLMSEVFIYGGLEIMISNLLQIKI